VLTVLVPATNAIAIVTANRFFNAIVFIRPLGVWNSKCLRGKRLRRVFIHLHYLPPRFTERSSRKSGLTIGQNRTARDSQTRGVFKGISFRLVLEGFPSPCRDNYFMGAMSD
jgi:hypothetical protein